MVKQRWRMMGASEAVDGLLLSGISTVFIFAVTQGYLPIILANRHSH
jgi:hypothetical protein